MRRPHRYRRKFPKRRRKQYRRKMPITKLISQVIAKKQETKHVDVTLVAQTLTTTFSEQILTDQIAQGVNYDERVGDEIIVTGVFIKGEVIMADTYNICRLILLNVISTDAANPITGFSDMMVQSAYPYYSPFWRSRRTIMFKPLADRIMILDVDTPVKLVSIYRKCSLRVQYNNNGTAAVRNRLSLVFASDSNAVTHPTCNLTIRVYYKDA